jgi:hypothetical protein
MADMPRIAKLTDEAILQMQERREKVRAYYKRRRARMALVSDELMLTDPEEALRLLREGKYLPG